MQAMIFAAGLGTRLRPYTNDRPKALVEVGGKSLLEWNLRRLARQGVERVVVNVHHFADQVESFLQAHQFGLDIRVSDERDLLLDTGGGLLRALPHFEDAPILVHNVDVLSDLDLRSLYAQAIRQQLAGLLAVRQRATSRYLLFDAAGNLSGWRNDRTGEERIVRVASPLAPLGFSGISVLHPRLLQYRPPEEPVFSIIDVLLSAASELPIRAHDHTTGYWIDVGKPEALPKAAALLHDLEDGS